MANVMNTAGTCCLILSTLLEGKVSFPGSAAYTASLGSYFSLQQADVLPKCIVAPDTTDDVSTALRVLANATTTAPECLFAIRSGGHSSYAGASNIQSGVTIDLRGLDSIETSSDNSSVSVGSGATWGAIYSQLDHSSLSVAGGRSAGVGVGGLVIGGGISYLGPRYGWTCDTATSFEVVLANGSVITADETQHQDLLWALRGGTNNFGVVTKINLRTFEQAEIWGGVVYHVIDMEDEEIIALSEFSASDTYDKYSSLITTFGYSGAQGMSAIVNNMEYTKAVVNPPVFQSLSNLSSIYNTMRLTNMTDLSIETQSLQEDGLRQASATLTIEPTVEAINASVQAWNTSVPSVQDVPGVIWSLVLEPLPPTFYAQHNPNDNALGLSKRHGKSLLVVQLSMTWLNAEDDDRLAAAAKALIGDIAQRVGKLGALDPFLYLNYAAPWQQPIASYGADNVNKLIKIQKRYDPGNIFTHRVPGGFKLPRTPQPA
ncbi:hypothetical protein BKA67DRAFT_543391 [Truncatella angustata]|uniref:FAD-binding PCMH-type domain-containing protein n=1 Tax=Truncatella angustata TaxID=152316 RepID=A0A9P8UVE9_9PEZI|nr:uncharacterized protein BKA67DRAFT_543391 [Truncatella angustata]KAH6659050.1 hypothetical protein BKA67DRAFT_543391 [Truncatella angustata]KAH8201205.1 hypothetical protein TruAng_004595 [Truncatella angustata]